MADFPSNPSVDQTFNSSEGSSWTWTGQSWRASGGIGGGSSVIVSDFPPANPISNRTLWYNSLSGRMKLYYDDGDTQQWVDIIATTTVDTYYLDGGAVTNTSDLFDGGTPSSTPDAIVDGGTP